MFIKIIILISFMCLSGCALKITKDRFDFTDYYPKKSENKVDQDKKEINFGPGPNKKEEKPQVKPIEEPKNVPVPPKEEPSKWWWE